MSRRKSNLWVSLLPSKEVKPEKNGTLDVQMLGENILSTQRKLTATERNHVPGVLCVKIKSVNIDSVARNIDGHVVFNQVKHFAVRVIGNRSHPFNLVRIDVNGVGSTSKEIRLGRGSPGTGEFPISGNNLVVGSIALEFTFNYGTFGYGMSQQLLDEDYSAEELIQYSLLPRINPEPDNCEPNEIVLKTQAVPHPEFIPFEHKVYLSYGKDLEMQLTELGRSIEERVCFKDTIKITAGVRKRRDERVPHPAVEYQEQGFPSKAYIRYLSPIVPEEDETDIPKLFATKGKNTEEKIQQQKGIIRTAEILDSPFRGYQEVSYWDKLKQFVTGFFN